MHGCLRFSRISLLLLPLVLVLSLLLLLLLFQRESKRSSCEEGKEEKESWEILYINHHHFKWMKESQFCFCVWGNIFAVQECMIQYFLFCTFSLPFSFLCQNHSIAPLYTVLCKFLFFRTKETTISPKNYIKNNLLAPRHSIQLTDIFFQYQL